jgi:NADPH:quinone reductase-like Zn-dependent oxidoreductase
MSKDGSIKPPIIHKVMPLHEAAKAHTLVEAGDFAGKILLDPNMSVT